MPRKKSQRSLQRLCLENIARNMQRVWAKDYTDKYLDEYQFRYIQGPFSELELMSLMGERLTRAMLHLLLVPHLKELYLHICPQLVSKAIAQMVTARCKNLTSLLLTGCSRIPSAALIDLVEGLPGLTTLALGETQCNTQVLSAIGSTCKRLRVLDISDCKKLSPASLFHLAYDPTAGTFCCQALKTLEVDGMESSTPYGSDLPWALVYLLLALPSLVFLENEFATDAVCLIHDLHFGGVQVPPGFPSLKDLVLRWASANPDKVGSKPTLPLKELMEVSESNLRVVRAVCPKLAKVTVFLEERPGLSRHFLPWASLTSLTLECSGLRQLEEVLPVTRRLGTQLESLSLDGFSYEDEMSFHILLGHCPNLRKFHAALFHYWKGGQGEEASDKDGRRPLAPHAFPQLEDFSLSFSELQEPSPQLQVLKASLASLLKRSPRLGSIMLLGLPFSLDDAFAEVLGAPGTDTAFPHLTFLSLSGCKVSSGTIHRILSLDNPLGNLSLDRCPDIHRKHYDELLQRVSREGLEVRITWE
ncbi:uncharacterized protein LOC121930521 isoform X2 [Sceloporus undulatus]|uniref:uncharacterized protein LOC121930521 isoform X2 n=1 Tax=Sceloporus undulatus TaxID=8520 RepID=UPI001C4DCAF6|nr:uncharacterized protein LOC121930521 isoform X2 [Sceloporus undulatus]